MKKISNRMSISPLGEFDAYVNYVEIYSSSPENQNETHIHKEYEIYVNLTGNLDFEVENKIYHITRGSVIITRPYEYHHAIYRSDCIHKHYWVLIGGKGGKILESIFEKYGSGRNLIRLTEDELSVLSGYLNELISQNASELDHQISLLQMVRMLSVHDTVSENTVIESLPKDVLYALKYMDEHITEPIDAAQIARSAFVSMNTLERHFKSCFSMTPSAMLRKKRLIYSARLLREGFSVSEACEKSGFSDYSNYIATFRSFFGITPLKYKQNVSN